MGEIREYSVLPDGCFNIVVRGLGRVRLLEELRSQPYRVARVEVPAQVAADAVTGEALRTELIRQVRRVAPHLPGAAQTLESRLDTDIASCADIVAGALVEDADLRQQLLEELDPCRRASSLIAQLHAQALELTGAPSAPATWN